MSPIGAGQVRGQGLQVCRAAGRGSTQMTGGMCKRLVTGKVGFPQYLAVTRTAMALHLQYNIIIPPIPTFYDKARKPHSIH